VPLRPRRLQDDTLFDTGGRRAARQARRRAPASRTRPRLRHLQGAGAARHDEDSREQETEVGDAEVLRRVLRELGLHAWFRYQKFREEFQAPGVVIALDETPVGTYLEIEGSEEGILTAADALGCSQADFILNSYRGLFVGIRPGPPHHRSRHAVRRRRRHRGMIPALVLTAGLATRLQPLSLVRAKAALPVAGQPLVVRILRWLRTNGITDVVLNLHHAPETLTRILGDGRTFGLRVRYSWETPVLGSAGGPKRAAPDPGGAAIPDRQRRHAHEPRSRPAPRPPRAVRSAGDDGRSPQPRAGQVQRPDCRAGRSLSPAWRPAGRSSPRITSSACRWPRPPRSTPCRRTRRTSRWRRSTRR
jgi:adenylate cyclase class IV